VIASLAVTAASAAERHYKPADRGFLVAGDSRGLAGRRSKRSRFVTLPVQDSYIASRAAADDQSEAGLRQPIRGVDHTHLARRA